MPDILVIVDPTRSLEHSSGSTAALLRCRADTGRSRWTAFRRPRPVCGCIPDYLIDVAAEQAAARIEARLVVWLHPVHWYSACRR
jgi:glutathione-regulated potassium-efflux system ancillary protein KefF